MEHIERAGIHSGDSMAACPSVSLTPQQRDTIVEYGERIARSIEARGLINIQFVIDDTGKVFVLEVNPRASRTIPYLSKTTGIPMVPLAMVAIMGHRFAELGLPTGLMEPNEFFGVKAPVFSFAKMIRVDVGLGPEMKSTGEVMGIARDFPQALKKAMVAAGMKVPKLHHDQGERKIPLLCTVADRDKAEAVALMDRYSELGFEIFASHGTAEYFQANGLEATPVYKLSEGRPHIIDYLMNGRFELIINTISDNRIAEIEARQIRRAAVETGIPVITSLDTAAVFLSAIMTPLSDPDGLPHITEMGTVPKRFADLWERVGASHR